MAPLYLFVSFSHFFHLIWLWIKPKDGNEPISGGEFSNIVQVGEAFKGGGDSLFCEASDSSHLHFRDLDIEIWGGVGEQDEQDNDVGAFQLLVTQPIGWAFEHVSRGEL